MKTHSGACFQISEFKVFHIFKNIDELMGYWSFPIQDGYEYCIQPRKFNWKKPTILGWRLIQILRDANDLRNELSYEFRFPDRLWENICTTVNQIFPEPSDEFRLRDLIRTVIEEHGRPMFNDIIAAMVKARHPSSFPQSPNHELYAIHCHWLTINGQNLWDLAKNRYEVGGRGLEPLTSCV